MKTVEVENAVGRYLLIEEIGRGAMAVVFRARHTRLGRDVALKLLLPVHAGGAAESERLRREALAIAALDDPHVVPIYDVDEHEGRPFLVLKLLEGGTLAGRLATGNGPPDNPDGYRSAAELMATVARAVHHVHERGILHRDLKPANILLDAAGRPYVSDFGLASWLESEGPGSSTSLVGTPTHMAPEQAAGLRELTPAVDIFALGVVFYELLTGQLPFIGATRLETVRKVIEQAPLPPRRLRSRIPRDLETICLK
jgi:serine/threonine-protein kinase